MKKSTMFGVALILLLMALVSHMGCSVGPGLTRNQVLIGGVLMALAGCCMKAYDHYRVKEVLDEESIRRLEMPKLRW